MLTKMDLVISLIDKVKTTNKDEEEAKEYAYKYYKKRVGEVESLDRNILSNYDFQAQVQRIAKSYGKIKKLDKATVKLEVHKYAPELNQLHFKNGTTYKVNGNFGRDTMDKAIQYAAKVMSDLEFNNAIKKGK